CVSLAILLGRRLCSVSSRACQGARSGTRRSADARGCGKPADSSVADELAERGLLADRVEVGVVLREAPEEVGTLDRRSEVLERLGPAAGETLDTGEV